MENIEDLCSACFHGELEKVKKLLDEKNVNQMDKDGWTPLMKASYYNKVEIVRYLLSRKKELGLEINKEDKCTALHYACREGHLEVVKLLLDKENANRGNNIGWTPLIFASYNNKVGIVRYLLSKKKEVGIDVNKENNCTPLNWACTRGHTEVVKVLLGDKSINTKVKLPDEMNDDCRNLLKEHEKSPQQYRKKYSHLVFGKKKTQDTLSDVNEKKKLLKEKEIKERREQEEKQRKEEEKKKLEELKKKEEEERMVLLRKRQKEEEERKRKKDEENKKMQDLKELRELEEAENRRREMKEVEEQKKEEGKKKAMELEKKRIEEEYTSAAEKPTKHVTSSPLLQFTKDGKSLISNPLFQFLKKGSFERYYNVFRDEGWSVADLEFVESVKDIPEGVKIAVHRRRMLKYILGSRAKKKEKNGKSKTNGYLLSKEGFKKESLQEQTTSSKGRELLLLSEKSYLYDKIDLSQLNRSNKIGSGSVCDVYKIKHKLHSGETKQVAFKVFHRKLVKSGKVTDAMVIDEAMKMISANHPNCIACLGYYLKGEKGIFMELCKESLDDVIERKKLGDLSNKVRILKEIAEGMNYLHKEKKIIHKDLKPDNVLLAEDGTCKIVDFGISKKIGAVKKSVLLTSFHGTPFYFAPEMLSEKGGKYNELSDVFSFGVLCYCVYFEKRKIEDLQNLFYGGCSIMKEQGKIQKLLEDENWKPKYPKGFDLAKCSSKEKKLLKMISNCLEIDPFARMSFDSILRIIKNRLE